MATKENTCPETGKYDWACDCPNCVERRAKELDSKLQNEPHG